MILKQKLLKFYRNNTLRYWIMTSSIYSMSSVCPCCGKQICPVNFGVSALVGGLFALITNFKAGFHFIGRFLRRNSKECPVDIKASCPDHKRFTYVSTHFIRDAKR